MVWPASRGVGATISIKNLLGSEFVNSEETTSRSLKNRHIQMIALGGAIGTGLFYGSADSIKQVGPAVILSYLIAGVIIYWVMRMLGEMATHDPDSGSISHFAYKYGGNFAGFVAGWNAWFLYVLVSMAELSVVGIYINFWFPDVPLWVTSGIILATVMLLNVSTVRMFGEAEFVFTMIKIIAIVLMIVLGAALVFFGHSAETGISNLWRFGGFLPNGIGGLVLSMTVVLFAYGGTEMMAIAAGESENPEKTIPQATRQIIWRVFIFYVGTLTVLIMLYPWNKVGMDGSPFVTIFADLGIPYAPSILNFVVLVAAISVYNSCTYSASRMLYSLAQQGNAPRILARVNKKRVPAISILFTSACTVVVVVINFLVPNGAFMQVMAVATAALILTWVLIVLVHMKFRRYHEKKGTKLAFRAPAFPVINWIVLIFMASVVVVMATVASSRPAIIILPIWLVVLFIGFQFRRKKSADQVKAADALES